MNCFYHPSTVAVGICKSCGKGLCLESAVDLGKGLACKDKCEDDAKAIIRMTAYSVAMVDSRKGNLRGSSINVGIFYLVCGVIFILAGTMTVIGSNFTEWGAAMIAFLLGIAFVVFGYLGLRRTSSLPKTSS